MKNILKYLLIIVLMALPQLASAQVSQEEYLLQLILGLAVVVCTLMLAVVIVMFKVMTVVSQSSGQEKVSAWSKFWQSLTKAVPVEQEETVMTDHSYDGIRELDNRLPPWWLYGFYFTIVFGFAYIAYYHVFQEGNLQEEEYVAEMAEARAQVEIYLANLENSIDETNVALLTEEADLVIGKEFYQKNCVACHGSAGEGGIGPNLTDDYWLHGGDLKSVFTTIKYGIPQKGMISWQKKLTPKQMQQLSSYLHTLRGTNPPNAKEAQGDIYIFDDQAAEADDEI